MDKAIVEFINEHHLLDFSNKSRIILLTVVMSFMFLIKKIIPLFFHLTLKPNTHKIL